MNLFDDPVTLALEHPLLPVLVVLGAVVAWRGVAGKRAALSRSHSSRSV